MIRDWMTMNEAQHHFQVARSTINRWRTTHNIRELKLTGHPTRYNLKDLQQAEVENKRNNPALK